LRIPRRDPAERLERHVGVSIARCRSEQNAELTAGLEKTRNRNNRARIGREQATKQRAPGELDRHLIRHPSEVVRKALHTFDQERCVRKARSFRTPGAAGQGIGARVDGDREGTWLGPRPVQDVAAIARAHVHEDVTETGGYCGDLTDVDVDEMLAEKSTHTSMVAPGGTAPRLAIGKSLGLRCRG